MYSPSAVKDWLRCPVYRQLKRKVEPIGEWTPNLLMGRAMDAIMVPYFRALQRQEKPSYVLCLARGDAELRAGYEENEKWTLEALEILLKKTALKAFQENVIGTSKILMVDESLGVGRPDLITVQTNGKLIITDRKLTMKWNTDYQVKTLTEYETDDQFWHYAWEAQESLGREVEWLRVWVNVAAAPVRSILHPWRVNPKRLEFWVKGAQQHWRDMAQEETGDRDIAPNWSNCMGKYGRCPFYEWCHDDESQRELFYRPVVR